MLMMQFGWLVAALVVLAWWVRVRLAMLEAAVHELRAEQRAQGDPDRMADGLVEAFKPEVRAQLPRAWIVK